MKPRTIFLTAWLGIALLQLACHQAALPPQQPQPEQKDSPKPDVSAGSPGAFVDLSSAQVQSIRIEPVGTRKFSNELAAVASVSFEEDPAIVQQESTLLSAQANLDANHRELLRVQGLGESNGIAPKEFESARAADLTAAAAVRAAREALRAGGVSDREIDTLERSGRFGADKSPRSAAWVLIDVPETESPKVRVGAGVRISVPAYPGQWFTGTAARIYAAVDPNTHRLAVRAQVQDPDHRLRPGMLADARIQYGDPVTAAAIPTTAAVRESDATMIAWVTENRARFFARRLKLGHEQAGYYPVLAGLKANELVVAEGGVFLSNVLEAPPSD